MAGKRLLDAAKVLNASGSVAKQHVSVRRQQWDVYTRNSTLARAVKNQTDRVTVTAGAAWELARRFNETGPSWREGAAGREAGGETGRDAGRQREEAWYTGAKADASAEEAAQRGTPASEGHEDLSPLRRRELQREAEGQIPSTTADAQSPTQRTQGQDVFNERPESVSSELSSLPRSKLPKHAGEGQESDEHVGDKSMNQDVFYKPSAEAEGVEKELPEGANLDGAFMNPRVSRMMGKSGPNTKNPFAGMQKLPPKPLPEMVAAEEQRKKQQAKTQAPAVDHSESDAETQNLAASIAQDAKAEAQAPTDAPVFANPYEMRESRVPSSRFGRLWQYGGLATSMAFGAVGEGFRRVTGGPSEGSIMLSEGNIERLVAKLSRMRGAALKLGQVMSFQDSKMLPPTINTVLQRVQDSADYMPPSQRDKVLVQNLGQKWRDLFSDFEEKPFAAASIGQVHKGTLASNGKKVAIKIQYPGVRNSIDSDLNNLSLLLTASRLLPKGLFLDRTIDNARVELAWECDYEREAQACIRFAELLRDESTTFKVPDVYTEACGRDVLTAEFLPGTAVTKMHDLTQADRDWVGTQILRLCLRELMEWRFMQTDPNWTNFLYNRGSQKLELLDFGASREFPSEFVEPYVALLIAASKGDRETCKDLSIQLGYLTGRESQQMLAAHVDSILTLAEPFVQTAPEVYDFEDQTITERVKANIGLMLRERMAPPPEETYSLHRKLSGAFLLCARLRSRVRARDMFKDAVAVWDGWPGKIEVGK